MKQLPKQSYLLECVEYDQISGTLTWKERPETHFANKQAYGRWNTMFAKKIIGKMRINEYLTLSINGIDYRAHRLIWVLMTGNEPSEFIDHIDGDRANNRWANLREATHAENCRNLKQTRDSKGVSFCKSRRKWNAAIGITVDGKRRNINLGRFDTKDEAQLAYNAGSKKYHGEFGRVPTHSS